MYAEPQNAELDPETYEIAPSTDGLSFDVAAAQALFERAESGESFLIPLERTAPEITTEKLEASLFADLLSEAESKVGGTSNRISNVRLAGSMCDGSIVLPGEEFSYWSKISPCSAAQGFLPAPAYSNGKTVQATGGGVCQMSSTIYYAALKSNLEIVERRPHTYAVDYVPDGCDAMFSGGSSDFRFKNNTDYPIKIVVNYEAPKLTVQIWGTKTDDTYVEMERGAPVHDQSDDHLSDRRLRPRRHHQGGANRLHRPEGGGLPLRLRGRRHPDQQNSGERQQLRQAGQDRPGQLRRRRPVRPGRPRRNAHPGGDAHARSTVRPGGDAYS